MAKYEVGQTVEYKPIGGPDTNTPTSTGTIENIITSNREAAGDTGVHVQASEDAPRYEIRNANTGKTAAYKEDNILGTVDDGEKSKSKK